MNICIMEPLDNQHEGLEDIEKMDWIIELKKDLKNIGERLTSEDNAARERSIYRLPEDVTCRYKEAYKPLVVSIGPYHNGKEKVKEMERHKLRALHRVLHRSKVPLESYVNDLKGIVDELRGAYDDLDDTWKQDISKFLRMMILDGCFIVEILRGNLMKIYEYDDDESERLDDDHHSRYRHIFTKHGNIHVSTLVRRDMLLIENQVPLLLLEKILHYDVTNCKDGHLLWLILQFCSPDDRQLIEDETCLHILDAYRKNLISKLVYTPKTKSLRSGPNLYKMLPYLQPFQLEFLWYWKIGNKRKVNIRHSATEMKEAGIKFKYFSEGSQRISFEGTTLWLPKLLLDATSESIFLNIMAFERFYKNDGNELTKYVFFKSKLIASVSDVKLLKEEGIIDNSMGSDEDVVKLFHQLSREITRDQINISPDEYHWYVVTCENINNYYCSYISTLRKWKYNLMSTYCKSPWTIIAVLCATSILCLTATQTAYTILSYGNRETSALPPP